MSLTRIKRFVEICSVYSLVHLLFPYDEKPSEWKNTVGHFSVCYGKLGLNVVYRSNDYILFICTVVFCDISIIVNC